METQRPLVAVILAAGKSTRMDLLPKAALPLAGSAMGRRVMEAVKGVEPQEIIVVVGHQADKVKEVFGPECTFVLQQPQLGTAHALLTCEKVLKGFLGDLLVVNADHPLVSPDDLHRLIYRHRQSEASASLLTWRTSVESSYGRILRSENGRVSRIVEERDATPEQLALPEINLSMYCFAAPLIFDILRHIRPDNAQQEYYLTDAIQLLARKGKNIEAVEAKNPETGFGVNTPEELSRAEAFLLREQPLT